MFEETYWQRKLVVKCYVIGRSQNSGLCASFQIYFISLFKYENTLRDNKYFILLKILLVFFEMLSVHKSNLSKVKL